MGWGGDERGIMIASVFHGQDHLTCKTQGLQLFQMSERSQRQFGLLISKFKCLLFVQSRGWWAAGGQDSSRISE